MVTYACSDIHGNYDAWIRALDKSEINLEKGDNLVILGDLIDRGNKSYECVTFALEMINAYPGQVSYLMGNHEKMFLDFVNVKHKSTLDGYLDLLLNGQTWLGNGGTQTVRSFLGGFPEGYIDMHELFNRHFSDLIGELNQLPYYKIDENNNCVYVHAGFESNVSLNGQDINEMV